MKQLAQALRASRQAQKKSLEALAEVLGVDRSLLSRYERGVHAIPEELVDPWASCLGLQVELVVEPLDKARPSARELSARLNRLGDADRLLLLSMLERMESVRPK